MKTSWLAVLACVACAPAAAAQTVRGAVVADGDRPVSGVVVTLVDAGAKEVARALTNERGEYVLLAPRPGSYRVRTLRIGFESLLTEPFILTDAQTLTRRLTVSTAPFTLDTVRAVGRNQCKVVGADSASSIAALWDQVRAALIATQLTYATRTIQTTSLSYERMMGIRSQRIGAQSVDVRSDFVRQPWKSLSADSLRKIGYVYWLPDSTRVYQSPDIAVLTSDGFIEDHCLRIAKDSDARRLGVEFEPSSKRVTDIRGTIWLDRKTNELTELEYRYANHIRTDEERNAGGWVGFARMSNGMWAISRWSIRMPSPRYAPLRGPDMKIHGYEWTVDSVKVTGGELIMAMNTGMQRDTLWIRPPLSLRGLVLDSISGAPVARAVVSLDGTVQVDTTDRDGRFTISGVLPGRYALNISTPSLDSVGAIDQHSILFSDSSMTLTLRAPSGALLAASMASRTSALTGTVTDSAGKPLGNVEVLLSDLGLSTLSDAAGAFRIGNVKPGSHSMAARRVGYAPMEAKLAFTAGKPTTTSVVLSQITTLDSMTTLAVRDPNMLKFEERRKAGYGAFITLDSIKASEARGARLATLLERRPQWAVMSGMGQEWAVGKPQPRSICVSGSPTPPKRAYTDSPFGRCLIKEGVFYVPVEEYQNRGMPIACYSRVYLDGEIMNPGRPTPPFNLQQVPVAHIEAVELYVGSETPRELIGDASPCGVLVIHTRRLP
jgi:protocatechuate 3,4-dioxygenase beta subunit